MASQFAEKVTTFAPLTDKADAFSPSVFAGADFRSGRVAVAQFDLNTSQKIGEFRQSYTGGANKSKKAAEGGG